jgi:hypothetical protein
MFTEAGVLRETIARSGRLHFDPTQPIAISSVNRHFRRPAAIAAGTKLTRVGVIVGVAEPGTKS